jgi:predicted methyltransferase family protein
MYGATLEPFVTEVRSDMETIGLRPVGSATLIENHDSLVLGQGAREALAGIDDEHVRELVRDYFINQFFRRDVYVREGERLDDREQRQRLLANAFALTRGAGRIEYRLRTPAGDLTFDNSAARAIIAVLTAGPCRLSGIIEQCRVAAKDVVANAIVLCASNQIRPVEPVPASVTKMNAVISRQLGGQREFFILACPAARQSTSMTSCMDYCVARRSMPTNLTSSEPSLLPTVSERRPQGRTRQQDNPEL